MPKKSAANSTEDTVLWQRVTSQVTPLKSTTQSAEFVTMFGDTTESQKRVLLKSEKPLEKMAPDDGFLRSTAAVTKKATSKQCSPIDLRHGEKAGIDGGTQRRLFRGEVPFDSRLDLHGMRAAQAQNQLVQFIESAAYEGWRCVLVITGKGSGVLHGHVPNWLKRPPLSFHVLAIAEARPKDGGSGALYVLLRRKRGSH
jgi:DNA-nicking Smr family endonuclease